MVKELERVFSIFRIFYFLKYKTLINNGLNRFAAFSIVAQM